MLLLLLAVFMRVEAASPSLAEIRAANLMTQKVFTAVAFVYTVLLSTLLVRRRNFFPIKGRGVAGVFILMGCQSLAWVVSLYDAWSTGREHVRHWWVVLPRLGCSVTAVAAFSYRAAWFLFKYNVQQALVDTRSLSAYDRDRRLAQNWYFRHRLLFRPSVLVYIVLADVLACSVAVGLALYFEPGFLELTGRPLSNGGYWLLARVYGGICSVHIAITWLCTFLMRNFPEDGIYMRQEMRLVSFFSAVSACVVLTPKGVMDTSIQALELGRWTYMIVSIVCSAVSVAWPLALSFAVARRTCRLVNLSGLHGYLSLSAGRHNFRNFLQSEFSQENLVFLELVAQIFRIAGLAVRDEPASVENRLNQRRGSAWRSRARSQSDATHGSQSRTHRPQSSRDHSPPPARQQTPLAVPSGVYAPTYASSSDFKSTKPIPIPKSPNMDVHSPLPPPSKGSEESSWSCLSAPIMSPWSQTAHVVIHVDSSSHSNSAATITPPTPTVPPPVRRRDTGERRTTNHHRKSAHNRHTHIHTQAQHNTQSQPQHTHTQYTQTDIPPPTFNHGNHETRRHHSGDSTLPHDSRGQDTVTEYDKAQRLQQINTLFEQLLVDCVGDDATEQVNLSATTQTRLVDLLPVMRSEGGLAGEMLRVAFVTLRAAQLEIWKILKQDSFPRFRRSSFYRELPMHMAVRASPPLEPLFVPGELQYERFGVLASSFESDSGESGHSRVSRRGSGGNCGSGVGEAPRQRQDFTHSAHGRRTASAIVGPPGSNTHSCSGSPNLPKARFAHYARPAARPCGLDVSLTEFGASKRGVDVDLQSSDWTPSPTTCRPPAPFTSTHDPCHNLHSQTRSFGHPAFADVHVPQDMSESAYPKQSPRGHIPNRNLLPPSRHTSHALTYSQSPSSSLPQRETSCLLHRPSTASALRTIRSQTVTQNARVVRRSCSD